MAGIGTDRGNVRALRPPRVLLAVADRRFVRVAAFLLARHGFEVDSTKRPRELLDLMDGHPPDVVILDGTQSLAEAARLAGAIEALHPHVAVIVVAEEAGASPAANLHVFPKWTSFDQLAVNIERMHLGLAS
jgi:DNA-binding NtrC family response regulator